MTGSDPFSNDFVKKATRFIEENLSNDRFGVTELADALNMSRSNLLRKIKKLTDLSASQFIRKVRLEHAMEMLRDGSYNVSEVSFKTGFGSASYFIKCFRDQYGYPPGEVGKRMSEAQDQETGDRSLQNHQLAAIMFTDIQGYTALMQRDEGKAVEYRNRHRKVFNSLTQKYKGRILQYYGDGTLSTFSSAIDAVRTAIEMQHAFRENPRIPVRIGIHTGDIIFTNDDIIGDGVNVASRIESLGVAGSVLISEKVYDEVKNQPGIRCVSLGEFELKNVDKPHEVYAVRNPGLVVPKKSQISGKLKDSGTGKNGAKPAAGKGFLWAIPVLLVIILGYLVYTSGFLENRKKSSVALADVDAQKSIAVLPFLNDSPDSANVYIINGLMESILNNLQSIKDLRVISRTSVEKYRNTNKLIPEIAGELSVRYILEGSGQKIGDQILLHVQLIDAATDSHLWSEQYDREVSDIFGLQREVAKKVADGIQVIVTPEEESRINKIPTDNLEAYDSFLKGLDQLNRGSGESLKQSITWFDKATDEDKTFAMAYALKAVAYYFLDYLQVQKVHAEQINNNADLALFHDEKLPQGMIAKALYYKYIEDYGQAVSYLEKALDYNPNSALALNLLSDIYNTNLPDTEKYLEYALRGIQIDIASNDSTTVSFTYLHVSNSLIQTGFVAEAAHYIDRSLDYNPRNIFSSYVKAYIGYAADRDIVRLRNNLLEVLEMDTTRLDVLQEIAKVCYYMRDYKSAYVYYKRFSEAREKYGLNIYSGENAKIGLVFSEAGDLENAEKYFDLYRDYVMHDESIYKDLSLAVYYSYMDDKSSAIKHFRKFSEEDHYFYWILLFLEMDPLVDNIKDMPEFSKIMRKMEKNFWSGHDMFKSSLREKGLI